MLDWIFEGIITWISSVVSDMMDAVSGLFLQALGTDMTAMEEYFPFVTKAFTVMQRAAATELQYGEYIDPSLYGGSGEPYYRANAREAIAKAGYAGTIDEVALKLASLVKNSTSHWNYIGSPEYTYIAVGVTYESGMWYCAITVASENTYE